MTATYTCFIIDTEFMRGRTTTVVDEEGFNKSLATRFFGSGEIAKWYFQTSDEKTVTSTWVVGYYGEGARKDKIEAFWTVEVVQGRMVACCECGCSSCDGCGCCCKTCLECYGCDCCCECLVDDEEGVPAAEPCVTSDIDTELCPNGQSREECREIDPCEMCQQDIDAEGDMIEISMGLRNRVEVPVADEDEDEDGRYSCKGCSGTCCTGVPNQECTC